MATPKKHALKLQTLNFLSLVDNPANQHSHAVIAKRAEPVEPPKPTENMRKLFSSAWKRYVETLKTAAGVTKDAQSFNQIAAVDQLWTMGNAAQSSIASIVASDGDKETKRKQIDVTLSEYRDSILALDTDDKQFEAVEAQKIDSPVVPADATPTPAAASPTSAGASGDDDDQRISTMKTTTPQIFTDVAAANAHIVTLTKSIGTLEDTVEKFEAAEMERDPMLAITKGMPASAVAVFKSQQAEITALKNRNADADRMVRVAKIAPADAGLSAEEQGVLSLVIKAIDTLPADELAKAETLLKETFKSLGELANELEQYAEVGGSGADNLDAGNAELALAQKVEEVRKLFPKMSEPELIQKTVEMFPELYDENPENDAQR